MLWAWLVFGDGAPAQPGKLVFNVPLDLLRFLQRASSGLLPVLGPVQSPAEMLPTLAALREFVHGVLTADGVTDKDCD